MLPSAPSWSSTFSTDQPNWEHLHAPTIPPARKGSAKAVTKTATTTEPYVPNATVSQPALDSSEAKEGAIWQANATAVASTSLSSPQPSLLQLLQPLGPLIPHV